MLEYVEELATIWIETGQLLQTLCFFYGSPYCLKYMPKDCKSYSLVDQWYKKFIRQIKENPLVKKLADDFKQKQIFA